MICLISSALYLVFISYVTGSIASKTLNCKTGLTEKIFIGIAVSNAIFSVVSLYLPINSIVSFSYSFICLIYFLFNFRNLTIFSIPEVKPKNLFFLTYPVIILFGFFNSLYPPIVYDSGLYHIQSIEWIENYPVIPGLANLHNRFGFNPNIFILFAATSFEDILNQDAYSINFILFIFFSIWLLNRINKFFKLQNYILGFSLSIVLIVLLNNLSLLSSPTPDFICIVFPFFILLRYIEINISEKNDSITNYYPIIVMSVYIITVKLSAIPVLLLLPAILFENRKKINIKSLSPILLISLLILIPWLLRNIVLTGWLLYPFPGINIFSFDWKVPISDVQSLKDQITGWGRNPGPNFLESAKAGLSQWFPIWWTAQSEFKKIIFLILSLSPFIVLILKFFQKNYKDNKNFLIVYFISFFGFIFWFFAAPDWRFGLPFITMCLSSLLFFLNIEINKYNKYFISLVSIILISYAIYYNQKSWDYFLINYEKVYNITPKIYRSNINGLVQFKSFDLDNKVEIKYPIDDYRCFDEEVPCASYFKNNIHLRGDNLKFGFYVK